jgi:chemotaxis protein CheD
MTAREIIVRVADMRIGVANDVLVTVGLGSCVAILLHDPVVGIGGLAHVLLPSPALTRQDGNPAKFPQSAVHRMVELMVAQGARSERITGRLAGGASMFAALAPPGTLQMGERNLVAARQALRLHGIPLVGEAVGGDFGRTVRFRVRDGRVEISTVTHGVRHI